MARYTIRGKEYATLADVREDYNLNSVIVYRDVSMLDKITRIVGILSGIEKSSGNSKTMVHGDDEPGDGTMHVYQLAFYVDNGLVSQENVDNGCDVAICGTCMHRGTTCYVQQYRAPRSQTECLRKGRYLTIDEHPTLARRVKGRGGLLRLGAYGDPASVPADVINKVIMTVNPQRVTGYTHQWRYMPLVEWCMASCDTVRDCRSAAAYGYHGMFLVVPEGTTTAMVRAMLPDYFRVTHCPASAERGARVGCAQCGLCNGSGAEDGRIQVVIIWVHGNSKSSFDGSL